MDDIPPGEPPEENNFMPITAAPGTVWQLLNQFIIEDQQAENVLYFQAVNGATDVGEQLGRAFIECFLALVHNGLSKTVTFERVVLKQVSPTIGADVEVYPEADDLIAGDALKESLPSYASALISLKTTRAGRSGKGRMYIGGVPEADTIASKINSEAALWAALAAFAACMAGKFILGDLPPNNSFQWGVMSRSIGGLKPPFAVAGFAAVTQAVPRQYLATTRSRMVGRGR